MYQKVFITVMISVLFISCSGRSPLLDPDQDELTKKSPDSYTTVFETSKGNIIIDVTRDWAPNGADRFYYLVNNGFYDSVKFFRVLPGFVAQFGAHGDTAVAKVWKGLNFSDDPVKHSNSRGTVTFAAGSQPDSRTTHIFINYANNSRLDKMRFAPIGEVAEGMDVVDSLYSGYGEGAPYGNGPDQMKIAMGGNEYLDKEFPELDFIIKAYIKK